MEAAQGAGGAQALPLGDEVAGARADAATGLIDVARLGDMLQRIRGRIRHVALEHLSPFSVPILLELGKERSPGDAREMLLADAEADLIAEATQ